MPRFWELIEKIQKDKYFATIAVSLLAVLALYLNASYWHISFLGWLFLLVYLFINSIWLGVILAKLFTWTRGWSLLFGFFFLLHLCGLTLAIPIELFRFHSGLIAFTLFLLTLAFRLIIALPIFSKFHPEDLDEELYKIPRQTYEPNKYLLLLLPSLFFLGLLFLLQGRTGDFVLSPWQVIPRLYLYVYLLVSIVVVLLIFSRRSAKFILFIIIAHSFLLHAYLPAVYETGFGGDKWRHLASENYIMTGEVYQPSLLGKVEYAKFGPFKLPAVLISGNKTSYGQQWALTIFLSEALQIDVFWIDYWLVFLLWSLFLPLLLYQLGRLIRPGRNFRLLLAFLPALFYPLQVFGAITLPVSLGFLLFIFALYGWIYYYKKPTRGVLVFNLSLSVLMFFGYVLYFILIWEVAVLVLVFKFLKNKKIKQSTRRAVKFFLAFVFVLAIPVLEVAQGFGSLKENALHFSNSFSHLADAFGHLSGLVAFLPQPSHVDQGNFLFNQTRADHAPVSFLSFRLWPLFFTVLVWLLIILGLYCLKYLKQAKIAKLFAWLFAIALSNYVISWYWLDGNHILARRLDQTIVFYMSIFLALGIMYFLEKLKYLPWRNKILITAVILGFIATSTYASGPHLQVVTKDEYEAAKYVWQRIDKTDEYYCVVANTWPLLALEAVSGRSIIGGGFPVGFEYAQPERVKIFEKMSQHPDLNLLYWAKKITHDNVCYYMNEDRWINDRVYKETVKILGEPEKIIGDVYIWRF